MPSKLTRRECVSKVCEIFDITCKITALTAATKIDLHELVLQKLDWDDKIPKKFTTSMGITFPEDE